MTVLLDQRPRRRPAAPPISIDHVVDALKACSLQKAATFNCPQAADNELSLPTSYRSLPRSATCIDALEALVILADRPLIIDQHKKVLVRPQSGSLKPEPTKLFRTQLRNPRSETPSLSPAVPELPKKSLGQFARRQLDNHLFRPILDQPSLEPFHPLLQDLAVAALAGRIASLRDLERKAVFLAPDFAPSAKAYRSFCETFIRHLQYTAKNVHDSDQCHTGDRPYSPSYFADLINHTRRYAAVLAVNDRRRDRQAAAMSPALQVSRLYVLPHIHSADSRHSRSSAAARGFTTHHISVDTEDPIASRKMTPDRLKPDAPEALIPAKRTIDTPLASQGPRRSMARRKAGAPILTYHCPEPTCRKTFTRPCDLTKHAKTHDRPSKCPELDCKYHTLGWPTDKECQRHWNDKHSPNPTVFRCLFEDCPYISKRESNCKQHMEKSHKGFVYLRAKGNGKTKRAMALTPSSLSSPATELTVDTMAELTPMSATSTTSWSPIIASDDAAVQPVVPQSGLGDDTLFDFGADFNGHFNPAGFDPLQSLPITPAMSDECQYPFGVDNSTCFFEDLSKPAGDSAVQTFTFSQMPTPTDSLFQHFQGQKCDTLDNFDADSFHAPFGVQTPLPSALAPHFSPYAQDLTLTGAHWQGPVKYDESLSDFTASAMEHEDFQLYDPRAVCGPSGVGACLFADDARLAATEGVESSSGMASNLVDGVRSDSGHNISSQTTDDQVYELFPELGQPRNA